MSAYNFNFQEEIAFARDKIEEVYGINVSTIEGVILRKYVEQTMKEMDKELEYAIINGFSPGMEAASRFMSDYYGMPPLDLALTNFMTGIEDECHTFMKLLQDRAHAL